MQLSLVKLTFLLLRVSTWEREREKKRERERIDRQTVVVVILPSSLLGQAVTRQDWLDWKFTEACIS